MMRAAAFVPNMVGRAPGQRVRIETWAPYLERCGWELDLLPFEDERLGQVLYEPGQLRVKIPSLTACYLRQLQRATNLSATDLVFVYREASMIGPAIGERLAGRGGVPVVYDLDDPTFVRYRSPTNGWASLLKFHGKTRSMLRRADRVIAINDLIGTYAARYNPSVTVIPNFVDVERYAPGALPPGRPVRLAWIGSHSTLPNLQAIGPVLRRLHKHDDSVLCVIAGSPVTIADVKIENRQLSAETEVAELQRCHVGLVPLNDSPWNRWKFFYKVIQYMAVGLPVVARRMGSNAEVIEDGVNGFLVDTEEQWYDRLQLLVEDDNLRSRMGTAARATIVERYSAHVHLPRVAAVFDRALPGR